jgi:signal transduction histidine kinase
MYGSTPQTSALVDPLIMVIEDDPDSGMLLEELLHHAHLRTIWHRDGAQALRALDDHAEVPSLILLDLHMPNMDGWTFRVEQRRRDYLRDVPVAVMSADGSSKAEAIDADLFVPKPLDGRRLVSAVQEALVSTERKRLMATSIELERLRSLGLLMGTVVHELSSPLQGMSGFLELAKRECERVGDATKSILRPVESALLAAESMREIVKDLRVFSRLESDHDVADVSQALQSAIRLSEPSMRGKATFHAHCPPNLPKVIGNEARLGQVFLNLLSNAVHAVSEGGPQENQISVHVSQAGKSVIVEISDTGVGMSPEILERAFDPFFTTKTAAEGTGIGLSFSKHIVEGYGGSISARSELGKGTTLRVELWQAP